MKNSIITNFFSKSHFKDLKILFILEFIIIMLLFMLINTPSSKLFIINNDLKIFNIFAFLFTLFVGSISSLTNPKEYFNLASIISGGLFTYGGFWVMFELLIK
jgi:hypothetical protein